MALDTLVLGGLNINDETNYVLEALDLTPPAKKPEWAQAADSDGASLVCTPLFDNRTISMTLRVAPQASKNAMLEKIGALTDILQECEKNPGGSELEYQPASATKKITFYVLTAAITGIPMVNEGGSAGWYNAHAAQLVVVLTCKPFGYGEEVVGAAAKSIETGLSIVTVTVPSVAGDVPAEGRLIVKDTAAVGRRFVEWGLEQRYYNAATSLVLDSEDMTPVGGAQKAALTGAYKRAGATNAVISTTLVTEPTVCCNTGVLAHIGTFRVKARVQLTLGTGSIAQNVFVRLAYQDGEGPLRGNGWQTPVAAGKFVELDLGEISLTEKITGTQKWLGQIEAYSTNVAAADTLHVDYLVFVPAGEGYGKARGPTLTSGGTVAAFDNFTTGSLSGNLNTRTPAVGAAWATSGATTDWTVEAGKVKRKTTLDAEPRFGRVGAAQGNADVGLTGTMVNPQTGSVIMGMLARWVNSTNYAFLEIESLSRSEVLLRLGTKVAGVTTVFATWTNKPAAVKKIEIAAHLTATLDGALTASGTVTVNGSTYPIALSGSSTALATGGALASGTFGILDFDGGSVSEERQIKSVTVTTLPAIQYCIEPSHQMQVRSDAAIGDDSTGTYYGPVPVYRGSRFYVPQDGSANRTSRILVKADRNDLQEADQQTIADAFTAEVKVTPRYHAVPR